MYECHNELKSNYSVFLLWFCSLVCSCFYSKHAVTTLQRSCFYSKHAVTTLQRSCFYSKHAVTTLQYVANQNALIFIKQCEFWLYKLKKIPTKMGKHSCKFTELSIKWKERRLLPCGPHIYKLVIIVLCKYFVHQSFLAFHVIV